jgi:hypothetical protein
MSNDTDFSAVGNMTGAKYQEHYNEYLRVLIKKADHLQIKVVFNFWNDCLFTNNNESITPPQPYLSSQAEGDELMLAFDAMSENVISVGNGIAAMIIGSVSGADPKGPTALSRPPPLPTAGTNTTLSLTDSSVSSMGERNHPPATVFALPEPPISNPAPATKKCATRSKTKNATDAAPPPTAETIRPRTIRVPATRAKKHVGRGKEPAVEE